MDTRSSDRLALFLDRIQQRQQELTGLLSSPEVTGNPRQYRQLSRELHSLRPLLGRGEEYHRILREIHESEELAQLETDADMKEMAREEVERLDRERDALAEEIRGLLAGDPEGDNRNVFLEIRAGAGGDEASLFAADLLRMYGRVAERRGWKSEVISATYSGIGGIKEIILYVRGPGAFRQLQFESGVHRVQRVPATEASGRIHTSTITVAVLPEVEDVEVEINPKDIRIDTYSASGPGGQHVNKTESAIRITHFPTGIVVTCQDEKSQHKNKDKAMKVLKARVFEHEMQKQQDQIASNRRSQVGTGERSEKIRTYNFPQSRVTDHRVSGRNFNIEFILDGDIEELIASLLQEHHQQRVDEVMARVLDT